MADRRGGTRRNKSSRGGRPPKRLLELIREDTFRRDRHAQLIEFEPLPRTAPVWADPKIWRALRVGQEGVLRYSKAIAAARRRRDPERDYNDGVRYSVRAAEGMRWEYVKAFSRAVRALHGGRLPWLLGGD